MKIGDKVRNLYGEVCNVTHIFPNRTAEVKRVKDNAILLFRTNELDPL